MTKYTERLARLVDKMHETPLTNILVSDPASIDYLTGYTTHPGERLFLLNVSRSGKHHLYLNLLFPVAEVDDTITCHTYRDGENILEHIAQHLDNGDTAIDKFWPSHFLLSLMDLAPHLSPVNSSIVDDLRGIKDNDEIAIMRRASELNDQAMLQLIKRAKNGLSEQQMVDTLAQIYQNLGCDGFSFEPIIAYGPNGADPHHETNHDTPQFGDAIVCDIGSRYNGYCSDMTRTFFYGEPDEESLHIYRLVQEANLAAIKTVQPGIPFSDIDKAARDVITAAGYGEYFTHRTGHFIGQEVHEAGDVSSFNHALTQVGQVFSIEPGIYLPGKIGVRIEDLVVVTQDGCEVLNHVSKDPIIISPA